MDPIEIVVPNVTEGDKWLGVTFPPVTIDEAPPGVNLVACSMFLIRANGMVGYKFRSTPGVGEGLLEITDPVTWTARISPMVLPLRKGEWLWDARFQGEGDPGPVTHYQGSLLINPVRSKD
jgi:hypothetical protein